MSLWVETPRLVATQDGQGVFDLLGTNWSLDSAHWHDDERVRLSLRRYPGDHHPPAFEVEIDCPTKQATSNGDSFPALSIEGYLEELYHHSQVKAQPDEPTPLQRLRSAWARFFG